MELRHVAWPTRTQTIVYAALVAGISIGIAIYLGFFDFVFRAGLAHLLNSVPQNTPVPAVQGSPITVTQTPAAAPAPSTPQQ
jgi:preprotein translocase SecE subunit